MAAAATHAVLEQVNKMSLFEGAESVNTEKKENTGTATNSQSDVTSGVVQPDSIEKTDSEVLALPRVPEVCSDPSDGAEQDVEQPPMHESMYVSAMEEMDTEPARRRDSNRNRFCFEDIEEENGGEWEGAAEPQWTWVSAGGCALDAERLPALWFIDTGRPEPEVQYLRYSTCRENFC